MKKQLLVCIIATSSLFISSCKKEISAAKTDEGDPTPTLIISGGGGCEPTTVTLMAGQSINAGTVSVTNDNDNIYVTYTASNGYVLTQTHLYVGDCNAIPVNNPGNPIPGLFPYNTVQNNTTSYTAVVPISAIGAGNCGCIAAHAALVKLNASGQVIEQQTGWGNGTRINVNGTNWGMKFEYCTCMPGL